MKRGIRESNAVSAALLAVLFILPLLFIVPFRSLIQTASTFPDGFTRHPSALQTDLVGLL